MKTCLLLSPAEKKFWLWTLAAISIGSCRCSAVPTATAATTTTTRATTATELKMTQIRLLAKTSLPKPASALVMRNGQLLLVEDDSGVYSVQGGNAVLHAAVDDLEGMALDDQGQVWVVAEEDGRLLRLEGEPPSVRMVDIGKIDRSQVDSAAKNKGFEGLAFLPARWSPTGKPQLLTVNEKKPKALVIVNLDATVHQVLPVPAIVDAALGDLSDIAVDPMDGRLWLLSDKTETLAIVTLSATGLDHAEVIVLGDIGDGEKPEAITFDGNNELLIGTDGTAKLYRYAVQRYPIRR